MRNDLILSYLHSSYLKGDLAKDNLATKVEELIAAISSNEERSSSLARNLTSYLEKITEGLDALPENYDFLSDVQKRKVLSKIFDEQTYLYSILAGRYLHLTTVQIWSEIKNILTHLNTDMDVVTVESAAPINSELKEEIRNKFSSSFVLFKVNRHLLGGIVIQGKDSFIDGSWRGKIMGLAELV